MNKKERVKAVISGSKPDRIPCGFWYHFPETQFNGEAAIDAHLDFLKETDVDMLKIMNENLYQLDNPPVSAGDWADIKPLPLSAPLFQNQLEIVRSVLDRIEDDTYTLITIHGVFASAFHSLNLSDDFFSENNPLEAHLVENPEAVGKGLMSIAESMIEFSKACIDAGVDGVYYAALGGESYRKFSAQVFEQTIKKADIAVLEALKKTDADVFVHICKDKLNFVPYRDYPGDVFNWAIHENDMSLSEGYNFFKRPILGGLDDRSGVLVDGNEASISEAVKGAADEAADAGIPFMLGADCTLPTGLPLKNIRVAVDSVKNSPV